MSISECFLSNFCYCTRHWLWLWGCVCDDWKPSFLPHFIFNQRTFSRKVTAYFGHVGEQKLKSWPIKTWDQPCDTLNMQNLQVWHKFLVDACNINLMLMSWNTKMKSTNIQHSRAYSSSLLHVLIARNHLPFFKIFWIFLHFCPDSPF